MDTEDERRKLRVAVEEKAIQELRTHMQTDDEEKAKRRLWHFGKEVPIALVAAIVLQTAGVVWGAATLTSQVDSNKEMVLVANVVQTAIDRKQDEEVRRSEDRVMARLDQISGQLARVLEKGPPK